MIQADIARVEKDLKTVSLNIWKCLNFANFFRIKYAKII